MYIGSDNYASDTTFKPTDSSETAVLNSNQPDTLVTFEQIGARLRFKRGQMIYADGDMADSWYRVVLGTVRICNLLRDGRRHIAQFSFPGDCFGLSAFATRAGSAEAIDEVVVTRYSKRDADSLIDENPRLARELYNQTLCELANTQWRTLLLGRMYASERVASFLIEVFNRRDARHTLDLPMTRYDIADYLGLTLETVCRELTALKRDGVIASSGGRSKRIELRNQDALKTLCEGVR